MSATNSYARTPAPLALRSPLARKIVLRGAFAVIVFAAWFLASRNMPAFILPAPDRVFATWSRLVQLPTFWGDFWITFSRVLAGFGLSAVVGALLGLLMGVSTKAAEFFEPLIVIINTVSSTIWAIFALIWFGLSEATTIFVVFMTAMPLILTNVWEGTRQVNPDLVELARSFRMTRGQVLRKIYLPMILPQFFTGARLAFGFGARVVLVAETLGASSGIGYRLRQAADLVQTDQVFAWTLTLVALMLVLEYGLLKPMETWLFSWRKAVKN